MVDTVETTTFPCGQRHQGIDARIDPHLAQVTLYNYARDLLIVCAPSAAHERGIRQRAGEVE